MRSPGWFTRLWMALTPPVVYDEAEEEQHRKRQARTVASIEQLALAYRLEDRAFSRQRRVKRVP